MYPRVLHALLRDEREHGAQRRGQVVVAQRRVADPARERHGAVLEEVPVLHDARAPRVRRGGVRARRARAREAVVGAQELLALRAREEGLTVAHGDLRAGGDVAHGGHEERERRDVPCDGRVGAAAVWRTHDSLSGVATTAERGVGSCDEAHLWLIRDVSFPMIVMGRCASAAISGEAGRRSCV